MINLRPSFYHHLLELTVAHGIRHLPAHTPENDIPLKWLPLRSTTSIGSEHSRGHDVEFEGGTLTQPGLVERIARDAGATVGSLPLMQHVLEQLWEGMQGRRLTHKAYEGLGEIKGALNRHADAVFAALTADEQRLVPQLFLRLVNVNEDGEATRRVCPEGGTA